MTAIAADAIESSDKEEVRKQLREKFEALEGARTRKAHDLCARG